MQYLEFGKGASTPMGLALEATRDMLLVRVSGRITVRECNDLAASVTHTWDMVRARVIVLDLEKATIDGAATAAVLAGCIGWLPLVPLLVASADYGALLAQQWHRAAPIEHYETAETALAVAVACYLIG
jgi:hypothetical protein